MLLGLNAHMFKNAHPDCNWRRSRMQLMWSSSSPLSQSGNGLCLIGLGRVLKLLEYSSLSIPKFECSNYFTVENHTNHLNSYGKVLLHILLLLLIIIIKFIFCPGTSFPRS